MDSKITITVSIPDELLAAVNALSALGSMKQDLGLVMDGVSKAPEEDIPAEIVEPQAPAVTFDQLMAVVKQVSAIPAKRDLARNTLAGAGFTKLSDVKDRPEAIASLYAQFNGILKAA